MFSLKSLLGLGKEAETVKSEDNTAKQFDAFKYDGVRALRTGHMEYAVKCFEHALQISDDLECWDYLSQAYLRLGQMEECYRCLLHLSEAQKDNEKIYQRMAGVAYMREDYEEEQQVSHKILEINPNSVEGHYLLAQSYIGQSNFVLAVAMLTKALSLDPNFVGAHLLRGETLLKMGDLAGATADVELLMQKMADNEDALLLAARVAKAKNDLKAALSYYDRLIDANPFSAIAFRERGSVKYDQGDNEGAEADAKMALEIEPERVSDVSGDYTSRATENIQQKVEEAYRNNNPLGL